MTGKKVFSFANILPLSIALYLLFSFPSISISQIILFVALICWIALLIKNKQLPQFPSFFWPLLVYSLLSVIAAIMSDNPAVSFKDSRELLLFLIVPLVYSGFHKLKQIKWANLALLTSASISIIFSLIYFLIKATPGERVAGFMGHYMTQAGLLMLFSAIALSMFFFTRDKIKYFWGTAFCLASIALVITMTRSAWIGVIVIAVVVLSIYKPKLLALIPIAAALFFLISPQPVKQRALSIINLKSLSNAQRIEYLNAGLQIIQDYPIFGTGPNTVHVIFKRPKYKLSHEARSNVHLHNNLIQIAAERGIPTLLAWLTFMVWTFISLFKLLKNKDPALLPFTATALASLLALAVAGLFEYNFGDSEITMLFLYLITLPFAFERIIKEQNSSNRKHS